MRVAWKGSGKRRFKGASRRLLGRNARARSCNSCERDVKRRMSCEIYVQSGEEDLTRYM